MRRSAFVRNSPFPPRSRPVRRRAERTAATAESENGPEIGGNAAKSAPRKALKAVGKRGREWITARSWLKKRFNWAGITHCMMRFEGCWFDETLGFAHPAKRRHLKEGELYIAVPACNPCHDKLEVMLPEKMRELVETTWAKTGIKPHENH